MQKFEILTYKNDPWLLDGETANDLIENGRIDTVFLDINREILNLYAALVKKEDMISNTKGRILKKCVYVLDENNSILDLFNKLPHNLKENNFLRFRKYIGEYLFINTIRACTLRNWFKHNYYPLPALRILCYLTEDNLSYYLERHYIVDFSRINRIKLPTYLKALNNPFLFYLYGLTLGDGSLNDERWKIVDGDYRKEKIKFSRDFLFLIKTNIERLFSTRLCNIYNIKNKNAYELKFSNKWFCRYLNFFFGFPFNDKTNVKIPLILQLLANNKENIRHILIGLLDTDGSMDSQRITFANKNKNIIYIFKDFLRKNKLEFKERVIRHDHVDPVFIIAILSKDIPKFASILGFAHPRKQTELINFLSLNSSIVYLSGINKRLMYNNSLNAKKFLEENKFRFLNLRLPEKLSDKLINIAKYIRPVDGHNKIRIIWSFFKKDKKFIDKYKKDFLELFDIDLDIKLRNNKYINSSVLQSFFSEFFIYSPIKKKVPKNILGNWVKEWNKVWVI